MEQRRRANLYSSIERRMPTEGKRVQPAHWPTRCTGRSSAVSRPVVAYHQQLSSAETRRECRGQLRADTYRAVPSLPARCRWPGQQQRRPRSSLVRVPKAPLCAQGVRELGAVSSIAILRRQGADPPLHRRQHGVAELGGRLRSSRPWRARHRKGSAGADVTASAPDIRYIPGLSRDLGSMLADCPPRDRETSDGVGPEHDQASSPHGSSGRWQYRQGFGSTSGSASTADARCLQATVDRGGHAAGNC